MVGMKCSGKEDRKSINRGNGPEKGEGGWLENLRSGVSTETNTRASYVLDDGVKAVLIYSCKDGKLMNRISIE